MRGFDPGTPLNRLVCSTNALLALPYLASALIFGLRLATHRPAEATTARDTGVGVLSVVGPWQLAVGLTATFVLFSIVSVYGLLRERSWVRWLVLLDAIGGYLLALTFPVVGALQWHPGQGVYGWVSEISPYFGGDRFIWSVIVGKAVVNTFNVFYFFGHPIFRLAKRSSTAHALWVVPGVTSVLGSLYVIATFGQFQSPLARYRADQEFHKVTCSDIRQLHGRERTYTVDGYSVEVGYSYDFTSVTVTMPSGRVGFTGGPGYFCRPPENAADATLREAAEHGDLAGVLDALQRGADIETESHFGWTPLMVAASKGHREIFDALIGKGAHAEAHDKLHESVLMICASSGRTEFVRTLLDKGVAVNHANAGGFTALMNAADGGHLEIVRFLIAHGARVNERSRDGLTARAMADRRGYSQIVSTLTEAAGTPSPNLGKTTDHTSPRTTNHQSTHQP